MKVSTIQVLYKTRVWWELEGEYLDMVNVGHCCGQRFQALQTLYSSKGDDQGSYVAEKLMVMAISLNHQTHF